ncbi:MAG: ABC transporter permease subunit [Phycisphaeraceae bacterium]|nr:ABC transporter permease subunit [Phycisphaeraceae bacterium]
MEPAWIFMAERWGELWLRLGEHVVLTGVSVLAAVGIGVPVGVWAVNARRWRGVLLGTVGILQTVPSLAMLTILLVVLGKIGFLPAIVALTLYALLPIVRNTVSGLDGVAPAVVEAARGVGMTRWQQMRMVKLPLAMPVMLAGVRTAAVVSVGVATLSAFIGAGGLGQFINRGLALMDTRLILLGAVPAAVLALAVDGSLGAAAWSAGARRAAVGVSAWRAAWGRGVRVGAAGLPVVILVGGFWMSWGGGGGSGASGGVDTRGLRPGLEEGGMLPGVGAGVGAGAGALPGAGTVTVGSKNFTEQLILGEIVAQLIEGRTGLRVTRRFNLGGTMICHGALAAGELDVYVEYTGTGLTAVLGEEVVSDRGEALRRVREGYGERFDAVWLEPLGFNNTYTITVRQEQAEKKGWKKVSDLRAAAGRLTAGFTAEFAERPDGYPGLSKAYGLRFRGVRDLDPSLMYRAIEGDEVQVICAFATDGRIAAYGLRALEDDRGFFPPYDAAAVVRGAVLAAHPEVGEVLNLLGGRISDARMQRMNLAVDQEGKSPREVARGFLAGEGLVEGN